MVKRRVRTGLDTDAIAQLDLGANNTMAPEDTTNQLELAGKGISFDDGMGVNSDIIQHYYDIGQLVGAGEDTSTIPKGPLDDEIEKVMGFGKEGPLGKEIAGIAGLEGNENLADAVGYGEEVPPDDLGIEDDANLAEYAQDFAGLDEGLPGRETPKPQSRSLTEPPMGVSEEVVPREKGEGYFGRIPNPEGSDYDYSTELSIGVNIDGNEVEIPSLVPTLTNQEIDYMVAGGEPTPEIVEKATSYARQRIAEGKDPFAQAGEQGQRPVEEAQPMPGAAKEALNSQEIRNFIELDSGLVLDQASEQQVDDYYKMINGFEAEDAAAAKRIEELSKKVQTKDLSKMDMILLGAALVIPALIAASAGGEEAMFAAIGKGLEGGVSAFKLGMEQQKSYGKELTDAQKQQTDAQAKRGKITEDFLQTVPDYAVKKELLGKETYTDNEGNTGVSFGAPNVYFDQSIIHDTEDIKAMRKEQPEIKKQVNILYNTDRVTGDIDKTILAIQAAGGNDPSLISKILTKAAPGTYGPKAVMDGKEVSLAQQLRGQLKQFTTVTEVSGETRYSAQLIQSIEDMLKDPTKAILDTTLDDLRAQVREVRDNTSNKTAIYLDSNGVLIEPIFQGYRTISPRSEYEPTDKQIQDQLRGASTKEAKALLEKGA